MIIWSKTLTLKLQTLDVIFLVILPIFFDEICLLKLCLLSARPLNWWIWTFQRCLWPYFWVWSCSCKLIQLSKILLFCPNVSLFWPFSWTTLRLRSSVSWWKEQRNSLGLNQSEGRIYRSPVKSPVEFKLQNEEHTTRNIICVKSSKKLRF